MEFQNQLDASEAAPAFGKRSGALTFIHPVTAL
jgi:hypothetical protein